MSPCVISSSWDYDKRQVQTLLLRSGVTKRAKKKRSLSRWEILMILSSARTGV
jgi:hypothetical protein